MNTSAAAKVAATILTVASLGFASSAQADAGPTIDVKPQNTETCDQQVNQASAASSLRADDPACQPVQQIGDTSGQPANPAPATTPPGQGAGTGQGTGTEQPTPEKSQEQLDKEHFERYCNMKDAEPSHSDKAFCDQYRKTHGISPGAGASSTSSSTPGHNPRTEPHHGSSYDSAYSYDKPVHRQPYQTAKHALGKQLPFTGLEIWQLVLIGMVLCGGGIGARRLLAS